MKSNKLFKVLCVIAVIIVICVSSINYIVRLKEKEGYKHTYIWETIEKLENNELEIKDINTIGVIDVFSILFYDKTLWDKLPLSENFKNKYRDPKSIIKKYNKYIHVSVGTPDDYDNENVIFVYTIEREDIKYFITGKSVSTIYYFEYKLDDKNLIDDLILLKEVDIDSMTAETYEMREY